MEDSFVLEMNCIRTAVAMLKVDEFLFLLKENGMEILGVLSCLLNGEREDSLMFCPFYSRVMKGDCEVSLSPAWRSLRKIYLSEAS